MAIAAPGPGDGGYRPLAEINVTPLVDVMLVLLIVFMVAAPMMTVGVPVQLPKTGADAVPVTREPLVLTIDRDGRLYLRRDPVEPQELGPRLRALATAEPGTTLYVRGDRRVAYGEVMRLMGTVATAGFASVSLLAEADVAAVQAR